MFSAGLKILKIQSVLQELNIVSGRLVIQALTILLQDSFATLILKLGAIFKAIGFRRYDCIKGTI